MKFLSGLRTVFLLGILFLTLSACQGISESGSTAADAVTEGILLPFENVFGEEVGRTNRFVTAVTRDFTLDINVSANLVLPIQRELRFDGTNGYLSLYAEVGQIVKKGDVLARLTYESTQMEINLSSAQRLLSRFDEDFMLNDSRFFHEIYEARNALELANQRDAELLTIQLAALELEYERFLFNSEHTRRNLTENLRDIEENLQGEVITAPFDGIILNVNRLREGDFLRDNPRIILMADPRVFFFQINMGGQGQHVLPFAALRYGGVNHGNIITLRTEETYSADGVTGPVLEFDAVVVTEPWAAGERSDLSYWLAPVDMDGFLEAVAALESETPIRVLNDLNFRASVSAVVAANSVALPANAVYPEDTRSFVYIYEGGNIGKRFVSTGTRAGGYVQILAGLESGAEVVILP